MNYNNVETRKRIGSRISELRKSKGVTIRKLADATGINKGNISRIENGRYSAGLDVLGKMAHALGCKIEVVDG